MVALILLMVFLLIGCFVPGGVVGGALPNLPETSSELWVYLTSGWLPVRPSYGSQILATDPLGLLLGILEVCPRAVGAKNPVILVILDFATLPAVWLTA